MATYTLSQAKRNKADEFYTQLVDIEAEMRHPPPCLFKTFLLFSVS